MLKRRPIALSILFRSSLLWLVLHLASGSVLAQQATLLETYTLRPCGHMLATLDVLLATWAVDTEKRIVVVYYGHRYRKSIIEFRNGKPFGRKLRYAHRDDGLSLAKGVELYLLKRTSETQPQYGRYNEYNQKLRERLVLLNGGYKEDIEIELWLVPYGADLPKTTPTLSVSDIKFGAERPHPVPDYYNCYSMYEK